MNDIPKLSFFITRKINNFNDNFIWIECVKQIRCFYKYEPIFIIDDCNNQDIIVKIENVKDLPVYNIHILNTDEDPEIKGRGEFASFYYYRKMKNSSRALFIRDSFFLLKPLDDNIINNCDIRLLFGFIDKEEKFKSLVNNLILDLNEGNKIIEYKYKYNWVGCFGVSCLISLEYLMYLDKHYNFFIISNEIINKTMKEVFERFFGLLITYDKKNLTNISLFGNKIVGNNYDLNYYNEKKMELIANNTPYFNYHQHQ